ARGSPWTRTRPPSASRWRCPRSWSRAVKRFSRGWSRSDRRSALPLAVEPIESRCPARALVRRGLPELPDRAIRVGVEAQAVEQGGAVRLPLLAPVRQGAPGVGAREIEHVPGVRHPDLVPPAVLPIVEVEALSRTALGAGPVLVHQAASFLGGHQI